jgi:hypothetical protein
MERFCSTASQEHDELSSCLETAHGWRLQVGSDSRFPATVNGLTNGGGTAADAHSPDETPKLSSTEFPGRTIGIR